MIHDANDLTELGAPCAAHGDVPREAVAARARLDPLDDGRPDGMTRYPTNGGACFAVVLPRG